MLSRRNSPGEQPRTPFSNWKKRLEDAKHSRDQQTEKDKTIVHSAKDEECKKAQNSATVIEMASGAAGAKARQLKESSHFATFV